jgi:hypothetical protein
MAKTIIACRPGFRAQAEAAFQGMEIEVDPNLTSDYEFRERELGLADLLEAELDGEEREAARKADPKNADTYVIPMIPKEDGTVDYDDYNYSPYLILRVEKNSEHILSAIRKINIVTNADDDEPNVRATLNALHKDLTKEGFKIYSISVATGLTWMGDD